MKLTKQTQKKCPCEEGHFCGDIIVTGISLPTISGLTFLENQIKYGCRVRNLAVMSSWWTDAVQKQARELGCEVIQKPFSLNRLYSWLDECEKRIDPDRTLCDWFKKEE